MTDRLTDDEDTENKLKSAISTPSKGLSHFSRPQHHHFAPVTRQRFLTEAGAKGGYI